MGNFYKPYKHRTLAVNDNIFTSAH